MDAHKYARLIFKTTLDRKKYVFCIDSLVNKYCEKNNIEDDLSCYKNYTQKNNYIPLALLDHLTSKLTIDDLVEIMKYEYGIMPKEFQILIDLHENQKKELPVFLVGYNETFIKVTEDKDKLNAILSFITQQKTLTETEAVNLREILKKKELENFETELEKLPFQTKRNIKTFILSRDNSKHKNAVTVQNEKKDIVRLQEETKKEKELILNNINY